MSMYTRSKTTLTVLTGTILLSGAILATPLTALAYDYDYNTIWDDVGYALYSTSGDCNVSSGTTISVGKTIADMSNGDVTFQMPTGTTSQNIEGNYGTYVLYTLSQDAIFSRNDAHTVFTFTGTGNSGSSGGSSGGGGSEEISRQEEKEYNNVVIGGQVVESTVPGNYKAHTIEGLAVTEELATVERDLGLHDGQSLYLSTWDIEEAGSPNAYASLSAAADSVNGTILASFQLNSVIGDAAGLKLGDADASKGVPVTIGIPWSKEASGKQFSLAYVTAGGAYRILEDTDGVNDYSITFMAPGGQGAYAVIASK
ncbi:MAG: hypothetical protein K6G23_01465 [Lachnospiraceae bacterium]|nr:hypothetical protein [Lachnospiraceae bacterium]